MLSDPVPAHDAVDVDDLAEIFGLLGDPGRVRILLALHRGPHSVTALAAASGLSPSSTSHALRLLRSHRIVSVTRAGRHAHYELADAHVRDLLDVASAHLGHSDLDHRTDVGGTQREGTGLTTT